MLVYRVASTILVEIDHTGSYTDNYKYYSNRHLNKYSKVFLNFFIHVAMSIGCWK